MELIRMVDWLAQKDVKEYSVHPGSYGPGQKEQAWGRCLDNLTWLDQLCHGDRLQCFLLRTINV
jgi:hypothetical protein